jgi:hypothetical protein
MADASPLLWNRYTLFRTLNNPPHRPLRSWAAFFLGCAVRRPNAKRCIAAQLGFTIQCQAAPRLCFALPARLPVLYPFILAECRPPRGLFALRSAAPTGPSRTLSARN